MLVLTRKVGEAITIGDDVKITIVELKGSHVRLGIEAPPDVIVHREEVYIRIQEANIRSADSPKTLHEISMLWKKMRKEDNNTKKGEKDGEDKV